MLHESISDKCITRFDQIPSSVDTPYFRFHPVSFFIGLHCPKWQFVFLFVILNDNIILERLSSLALEWRINQRSVRCLEKTIAGQYFFTYEYPKRLTGTVKTKASLRDLNVVLCQGTDSSSKWVAFASLWLTVLVDRRKRHQQWDSQLLRWNFPKQKPGPPSALQRHRRRRCAQCWIWEHYFCPSVQPVLKWHGHSEGNGWKLGYGGSGGTFSRCRQVNWDSGQIAAWS